MHNLLRGKNSDELPSHEQDACLQGVHLLMQLTQLLLFLSETCLKSCHPTQAKKDAYKL